MVNNTISSLSYVVVSEMASEGPALGLDGWKKPERILGSLENSWRPLQGLVFVEVLGFWSGAFGRVLGGTGRSLVSGRGIYFMRQAVLVARETGSGAGPIMGATDLVAVLRQGQVETFCHRGQGLGAAHHRRWTA